MSDINESDEMRVARNMVIRFGGDWEAIERNAQRNLELDGDENYEFWREVIHCLKRFRKKPEVNQ